MDYLSGRVSGLFKWLSKWLFKWLSKWLFKWLSKWFYMTSCPTTWKAFSKTLILVAISMPLSDGIKCSFFVKNGLEY
ncbi:MAG TPA: hypothetical protein DIV40_03760 [Clostridiales bacterium]|nr:hypothetical protein [Clostridiales bacterium]